MKAKEMIEKLDKRYYEDFEEGNWEFEETYYGAPHCVDRWDTFFETIFDLEHYGKDRRPTRYVFREDWLQKSIDLYKELIVTMSGKEDLSEEELLEAIKFEHYNLENNIEIEWKKNHPNCRQAANAYTTTFNIYYRSFYIGAPASTNIQVFYNYDKDNYYISLYQDRRDAAGDYQMNRDVSDDDRILVFSSAKECAVALKEIMPDLIQIQKEIADERNPRHPLWYEMPNHNRDR